MLYISLKKCVMIPVINASVHENKKIIRCGSHLPVKTSAYVRPLFSEYAGFSVAITNALTFTLP